MIDKELLARKISLISQDLDSLKALSSKTAAEFLADSIVQAAAERYLERMIGRMIDVNFHILTETGQPPPPDYYQSFTKLGEAGTVPLDFSRKLAACAGLRNRLVHEYDRIDPTKLFAAMTAAIEDVPVYLEHIAVLID